MAEHGRPTIVGIDDLWARVDGAERLLLALDYDGTLAPFQIDRMAAAPLPGMRAAVEALRDDPRVRLVMISGRGLDELAQLLAVTGIELIGSHGFERQLQSGERERTPLAPAQGQALDAAERFAVERGYRHERKAASFAVHSRGLDVATAEAIHADAREAWRDHAALPQMELLEFNGGVELRASGIDKGTALRGWLAAQGGVQAGDVAMYVGDDRTDEDAFAVLAELGERGLGIKVGAGETVAAGRIADCEAVAGLLAALADVPTRRGGRRSRTHRRGAAMNDPTVNNGEQEDSKAGVSAGDEQTRRLVVVSNRLPVRLSLDEDGSWAMSRSAGGLVTALGPVLGGRGGIWIGWPGASGEDVMEAVRNVEDIGYQLHPVALTADEIEGYYHGFSNEVLWPLFHDLVTRCNHDPINWPVYEQVNRKFAETIAVGTKADDYVWIQDYHLMLCAQYLREMGVQQRTGFFLHIPFPPLDIFLKLPWRFQILEGLLAHDLLGFQTMRDKRNFISCVRTLIPAVRVLGGNKAVSDLETMDHAVRVGAFPIGIDFKSFAEDAAQEEVSEKAWYLHEQLPDRKLILGVDRLDYTKGLPERLSSIGHTLERHPELQGTFTFIQVVVPSRESVPEYQQLKAEVERRVGEINGRFTRDGWTPIHYQYRSLTRAELLAYYRTCEVALVTPLKDGMNLVAKEYCACSLETGVLVLSEFAGAAAQLHQGALMVNPFDQHGLADAIHRALTMPEDEARERMRKLRRNVHRQSVFWWVDQFLRAAISLDLSHFPRLHYFVPTPPAETAP